jgi:hypothetical protein
MKLRMNIRSLPLRVRLESLTYVLALTLIGCGPASNVTVAPVSGVVTMDGKPLANARIGFQPELTPTDAQSAASDAFGVTDAEGRYELELVLGGKGASVGKNRVSISTYHGEADPATGQGKVLAQETVPAKYRGAATTLSFTVPAEGSDAANFELKSK